MVTINRQIKCYKIENGKKNLLFDKEGVVTHQSNSIDIKVKTEDLIFNLECKKNEFYLLREAQDILTEAMFDIQRKTRMIVITSVGESMFDVETIEYQKSESHVRFEYELFTSAESVGRYQFEVQF